MAYQPDRCLPFASMQYDPVLYSSVYGGQRPPMQQQPTSVASVTGLDGAKAYPLPPKSSIALFDRDEDVFYLKTTDDAGYPTVRAFRFEEVAVGPEPSVQQISRAEFDALSAKIDRIAASLGEQGQTDGEQHLPQSS